MNWVKVGKELRWNEGYDINTRFSFLSYCDEIKSGIVAGLNKKNEDRVLQSLPC